MAPMATACRIGSLQPAIAAMADGLPGARADRGAGGRAVEFMHDFAYLLPVTVICELIGTPGGPGDAWAGLLAYFTVLAAQWRPRVPPGDLLRRLRAVSQPARPQRAKPCGRNQAHRPGGEITRALAVL